jgi:tetratricopeptide (TPR) repeat protein
LATKLIGTATPYVATLHCRIQCEILKIEIMKSSVIFLAGMLMAGVAFGQNQKPSNDLISVQPVFNGTSAANQTEPSETIYDYLKKYVEYPPMSKDCGLQGTEVVKFVITPNGGITGFNVINRVCPKIDEEVIRILKTTSGKWTPGMVNGENVEMEQEVSLSFLLHQSNDFEKMAASYQKKGDKLMFVKNNPKKALKYYDQAIVLLPYEESLLAARGLCKYKIGDEEGAIDDWNRLNELAARNVLDTNLEELPQKYIETEGFALMMQTIKK